MFLDRFQLKKNIEISFLHMSTYLQCMYEYTVTHISVPPLPSLPSSLCCVAMTYPPAAGRGGGGTRHPLPKVQWDLINKTSKSGHVVVIRSKLKQRQWQLVDK